MADSTELISVSAVVPTRSRSLALQKTLESLARQAVQPIEIIVADASNDSATKLLCEWGISGLQSQIKWAAAEISGAAPQRNQGVILATQPFVWFFDDDIVFEPRIRPFAHRTAHCVGHRPDTHLLDGSGKRCGLSRFAPSSPRSSPRTHAPLPSRRTTASPAAYRRPPSGALRGRRRSASVSTWQTRRRLRLLRNRAPRRPC